MTKIIAFTGYKQSGKSTAANIVDEMLTDEGKTVVQVGFSDKLKACAMRSLGFQGTPEELIALADEAKESWTFDITKYEGWEDGKYSDPGRAIRSKVTRITGRQYLQWLGTEGGRETFGDTFWIDQVLPNPALIEGWTSDFNGALERMYPDVDWLLITDLRFPNEAQRVKSLGGEVWVIEREAVKPTGELHASERPLPIELWDVGIQNNGTIGELADYVQEALGL